MSEEDGAPEGALAWFPWGRQDLPGWRFDVITLLAIIGESSVAEHAQTLTASSLCLLPRIIPAPQALLRPTRPQRLPEVTAKMAGVYGGVVLDTVGFFANIMHPLEDLKPFAFKVLEIKHAHFTEKRPVLGTATQKGWMARLGGGVVRLWGRRKGRKDITTTPSPAGEEEEEGGGVTKEDGAEKAPKKKQSVVRFAAPTTTNPEDPANPDPERGLPLPPSSSTPPPPINTHHQQPPQRTATFTEKLTDILTKPTMVNSEERYTVPPAYYSPVHILSVISFLFTLAIMAAAAVWRDGAAMLAIALISVAGTVVCYASWWRPLLMNRRTTNKVPRGDVVIRTREGAFVLIRCTEEVARELYSGTEECRYVSTKYHRAFMGLGMVLLMVAVVLLGNCGWDSQVFIGGSYIFLNGLYWVMGLLPQRFFWDLGRYDVEDVTPGDARRAHETTDPGDPREGTPSFTRTLWFAVRETKHGAWVERSGAMPGTDEWKEWLKEAVGEAWKGNRRWEAVRRKNEIMKDTLDASSPTSLKHPVDEAEQHAPLLEVQPPRRRDTQGQGGLTF
ncbi:hypothetical protein C8A00DRAFT_12075 [Chaetomidium leptoderma]|uniref:Uncharacterized protein n=1 Tax=Chaetomidium leptoderma TaxID=669021 RepID=A0AAN6VSY4_9PEZI|nr:hypothetical protein C8A00DRAFT_12075 [Chaetomidium leptoderma]